jgi:membrane protease YdiL (CAAX protease family)
MLNRNLWIRVLFFFLLEALVALPQRTALFESGKQYWGHWNWAWPLTLTITTFFCVRVWKLPLISKLKFKPVSLLFYFSYVVLLFGYCWWVGVPLGTLMGTLVLNTFLFQTCVSFSEEVFYRGVGIESIRVFEKRRFPFVAVATTSLVFGIGHGLGTLFSGQGFNFIWATGTSLAGLAFALIYLRYNSLSITGFSHFAVNTIGIVFIPNQKLIHDLETFGRLNW